MSRRAELEQSLSELRIEREMSEQAQTSLIEFGANLAQWHAKQSNTLFGALLGHIDSQIGKANADLIAVNNQINVEIPDERERIDLRRAFHRRLLSSIKFDIRLILFVVLFPKFADFMDNVQYLTPLGPAIYPVAALGFFATCAIGVMLFRLRQGKARWPGRRIGKWLAIAGAVSLVIAFWSWLSLPVKLWLMSPFFPSIWQVLGFSLIWFVITFIGAILTYHAGFRKHWNSVTFARATLAWASRGSLHIRTARHMLMQSRRQVMYFAELFGHHLRRPWMINADSFDSERWAQMASKFPPAIKVALAVEQGEDGKERPTALRQIIDRIYAAASAKSWRKLNFQRLMKLATRENGGALEFATAIDQDTPSTPNGSRARLLELVQDDAFMLRVGTQKHDVMMKEVQKSLLETDEILVRRVKPQLGQPDVLNWDEHLVSVIGNPSMGSPSLAQFAVDEMSRDGYTDRVQTVVYGPSKLISAVQAKAQLKADSTVELRSLDAESQTGVDLVLRLDIAGIDKAIPASALRLPQTNVAKSDDVDPSRCPRCGRLNCDSYRAGKECTWSGI